MEPIRAVYTGTVDFNLSAKDLRAFLAVVRTRSFSQAARQVHLSQSALSTLIQRLEEGVGARLFERTTRSVGLTAAGEAFAERAQRLLGEIEHTLADVRDVVNLRRGQVAVAALPSLAAGVVPRLFQAFQARYPAIRLHLVDTLSGPAFDLVREGRVDFALTAADPAHEDLLYEPLTADAFVLLCPAPHPLARRRSRLSFTDTLAWPHVSMPRTASVRQYLDAAALEKGVSFLPRYEVDHIATIGAMVACNLGVTALPSMAAELIAHHGLAVRELGPPIIRRSLGLVRRRDGDLSPAAQALCDMARDSLGTQAQTR
jgi:LysR family transcriptional regulator, carnitine catabolism transcriptional activator